MLTAAENERLTAVTPGAPMHALWRRTWIPAIRSARLVADGAPEKIRLLGEDYVAFRATDGRVGFFAEHCPHRGASLVLARNEDCALRCLFHGWKIAVAGHVVETPNDRNPDFPRTVTVRHFPTREAAGIVWVYLGKGKPPRFSDFVFTHLPEEQVWARAAIVDCNWFQGLEGTVDPAHVAILHSDITRSAQSLGTLTLLPEDAEPRFETEIRPWGMSVAALRDLPGGERYVRVTEYIAPGLALIPYGADEPQQCIVTVPVDTGRTLQWNIFFHYARPLTAAERELMRYGTGTDDDNIYVAPKDRPRWGQDREAMRQGSHSGLPGVIVEDFVIAESMGTVADRTSEFLCAADVSVTRLRRLLLGALDRIEAGGPASGEEENFDFAAIRSTAATFAAGADWRAHATTPQRETAST
jgi:phthalate 4,5-dioxygenase oxygenase subunit